MGAIAFFTVATVAWAAIERRTRPRGDRARWHTRNTNNNNKGTTS